MADGSIDLIDIGGRCLACSMDGDGAPTVVFENGLGTPMSSWGSVPEEVARFARAVRYDRAGIGSSDPVPRPRNCQDLVDDLDALLRAAAVTPPYVLVGHSLGGLVVRLFASQYPDAVVGMVLVDAAHEDQYDRFLALAAPGEKEGHWERFRGTNGEGIDTLTSAAQLRAAPALRSIPLIVLTRTLGPATTPGGSRPYGGISQVQMDEAWGTIQTSLARIVAGAQHIYAQRSGHFIQRDEPALVVNAIQAVVGAARGTS